MLLSIVGGLVFFVLIIASVMLHELGHFIPGKLFGVKITEFFCGFGRTLVSVRRGETEYGLKLLPLGGYVRLIGMYPPGPDGVLRDSSSGFVQTLADQAREVEWADISQADQGRLFYALPTWKKVIIMAGGITVNLLLAFGLFWGTFATYGLTQPSLVVGSVAQCVIPADRANRDCQPGDRPTPAAAAGLRHGDRFVSVNGTPIRSYDQLSGLIRDNRDAEIRITVIRDGQRQELTPTRTVLNGLPSTLDPATIEQVGYLGFSPTTEHVRLGPVQTLDRMWTMSKQSLYALAILPVKVYNIVADLLQGHPRDPNSPMSIVGASRVAGEVASAEQLTVGDKVASGAMLLGSLNLFLFWFNLVPLLPMDGGHIAGALWEWLKRRGARLLGRADPGYVDTAKAIPMVYVVGGLIFAMGIILILADLISPVRLR